MSVSVRVRPCQGLSGLCIERELRQHLKGNKRDNKQMKEENEGVMKEEHESV